MKQSSQLQSFDV